MENNEFNNNDLGMLSLKCPKNISEGHNNCSGLLAKPTSVVVPEKLSENAMMRKKKNDKFLSFLRCSKMILTRLLATFLISVCSFCRGQHANANTNT